MADIEMMFKKKMMYSDCLSCRRFSQPFLSDFDDFCGCLVICVEIWDVVSAACEFEGSVSLVMSLSERDKSFCNI